MTTDSQLSSLMPDPAVDAVLASPSISLEGAITTILEGYRDRPALGERRYSVVPDTRGRRVREYLPEYATVTYGELYERVRLIALSWRRPNPCPVGPGDFVCIFGFSGNDYVTIDLACAYGQAVSVPLQSTMAPSDLDVVLDSIEPTVLFATARDLALAAQLAERHESIRCVVAMDYDEAVDDERESYAAAQAQLQRSRPSTVVTTVDSLMGLARSEAWVPLKPADNPGDRMAVLIHSSGSTGTPKGAIHLERKAVRLFQPTRDAFGTSQGRRPVVRLAFLPLNHQAGRRDVYKTLAGGGTVYFTSSSDMSTLFEDIRLVRPTDLFFFPRALETIHRYYQNEVSRRSEDRADRDAVAQEVLQEIRFGYLGDRLRMIGAGSAPVSPELKEFIERCFELPLAQGYGSTEGGAITADDRVLRPPIREYKLRDVPELGYFTTDRPFPRGELCIKSDDMITGYFKRPEVTATLFDADGFLLTGDIMEEQAPDHLVFIDRRNDVLKLAQGEYVAPAVLAKVYEDQSALIDQVYLYGTSARSYLLAVIVPNAAAIRESLGETPTAEDVKALIQSELSSVAMSAGLRSFEIPRDILIEVEAFSSANGLVSPMGKRLRTTFIQRYGKQLEVMYADLERGQQADLMALGGRTDLTTIEKVKLALEAVLGRRNLDRMEQMSFGELGGDSLDAAEFAVVLDDMFGIEFPVHSLLSPTGNPSAWAQVIEEALQGKKDGVVSDTEARETGRHLKAEDMKLERFFDVGDLSPRGMPSPADQSQTVLLTGATGFLGRFLCLEWLERMSAKDGRVICLVRGNERTTARERLFRVFEGERRLSDRFEQLADRHLEVVSGDVAEEFLGLEGGMYEELATRVDRIVHSAALVNHMLDYQHLFGPNVVSTAEVVRLALATRPKRVDFISSMAVTQLVEQSGRVTESSPLVSKVDLNDQYGMNYAASKWAAELLLRDAQRRFKLPVRIYRGDMLLAHRQYAGQINVPDIFTRLLYSVIKTGLAPSSFYQNTAVKGRSPHYDGLPVDFVAHSVAYLADDLHDGVQVYHLVNQHDDGISLDTFVEWIEEEGYAIERIAEYAEWYGRFEAKLRALPNEARQLSLLPVIDSVREARDPNLRPADSSEFLRALENSVTDASVPRLTHDFITKCLGDLRFLGLLQTTP